MIMNDPTNNVCADKPSLVALNGMFLSYHEHTHGSSVNPTYTVLLLSTLNAFYSAAGNSP